MKAGDEEFPLLGKLLDRTVGAGPAARKKACGTAADCVGQADYMVELAAKGGYVGAAIV